MADAPIDVAVIWSGSTYPMRVASTATIADVKERMGQLEGLPSKRQKMKYNTPNREVLDDNVLISSLANTTIHLVGLNKKDDNYKQIFLGHGTDGKCYVTDHRNHLMDFDENKVGMSRGVYGVVTMEIDCLLKTEEESTPLDLASFQLMRNFKHPNSIAMENLYMSGKALRLVLSASVTGTLDGYVRKNGTGIVYNSNGMAPTVFLSKMMTELCGVLDKLIAKGIYPKKLSTKNLYLKTVKDDPQLKVLFNSVEPLAKTNKEKAKQLAKLRNDIKGIFNAYFKPEYAVNAPTTHFRRFLEEVAATSIGKNLGLLVKYYPHNWTDAQKSSYLIDLISSNIDLRPYINKCGISWPKDKLGDGILEELQLLKKLIEDENSIRRAKKRSLQNAGKIDEANKIRELIWNYKTEFPYDLVRLCRNLWKHFDTYPLGIKNLLDGNQRGALHALERWCPGVWSLIYNAVGLA